MHTNQLCKKTFLLSYYGKSICHFSAGGIKQSNHTIILPVSLHETATVAPKVDINYRWGSSWLDYGEYFYDLERSVLFAVLTLTVVVLNFGPTCCKQSSFLDCFPRVIVPLLVKSVGHHDIASFFYFIVVIVVGCSCIGRIL
jgi:hypothetical protein